MQILVAAAALSLAFASSLTAADAQGADSAAAAAFPLKPGALLKTVDGRRVGVIDTVSPPRDGMGGAAELIFNSKIIFVPQSTITSVDRNHFVTSLSYQQIKAL